MLLIWGLRTIFKKLGVGTFACPSCGADRPYTHKEARRWFTLFFIPIIPMKVLGEVVECDVCHGTFKPQVLNAPTASHLEEQLLAVAREGVVLVLGPAPTPAARTEALDLLSSFAGREWSAADLDRDLASLEATHLPARLAMLSTVLSEQGKERLVAGFARIAATGGVLSPDQRARIEQIAGGIGMTAAHTRGVIDEVIERV